MPQLSGVQGVTSQSWVAGQDDWGLMGWSGYVHSEVKACDQEHCTQPTTTVGTSTTTAGAAAGG